MEVRGLVARVNGGDSARTGQRLRAWGLAVGVCTAPCRGSSGACERVGEGSVSNV